MTQNVLVPTHVVQGLTKISAGMCMFEFEKADRGSDNYVTVGGDQMAKAISHMGSSQTKSATG
eukprot:CAMPEP_0117479718 /NCGR_PEP_ID=MMETSP0784-20121206/12027_1 /TAXON_ID=39447 /ORGANISM="" /LENGTH=62 /DNA_ID=CAMNT_0005274149 /DNA_START=185 /DNA_END=369 /DNA_ORIENTATION=-